MASFEEIGHVRKDFNDPMMAGGGEVGSAPAQTPVPQTPVQPETPAVVTTAVAPAVPRPMSMTKSAFGETPDTFEEKHEFTAAGNGQPSTPKFMRIDVDGDTMLGFSGEYNPAMITQNCIADKTMLLEYMVATERRYDITMSFPAYGVDPIVFDEVLKEMRKTSAEPGEEAAALPPVVAIAVKGRDKDSGRELQEMYEKIEVDGVLYLSCISECLDKEYLHKVIAEATEAVYMHGSYVYTMVGPKPITIDGEAQGEFIETLKLNSYELSVLLSYMQRIDGVNVTHGIFNGRSAIKFER